MSATHVDVTRLNDPRIAAHVGQVDGRIRSGFRLALDVLNIPLPEYAVRKPAGRPSIAKLMAAADADTGTIHNYRDEKLGVGAFAPRR
ncbi:hypothetical protein SAMN05192583_1918 [Sphingomonas gellani]|uniref:Uncharacterized protein n=1 Tax=Sphingomonas gellani TaxID=1166340 RepID=A0A1H8DG75_9SPHN|nr:hypothetical protein [Sphingomonas gellani]SEN06311.1 hypothetical protein SAMN05192583_1918 [Sphingomonas gellani]